MPLFERTCISIYVGAIPHPLLGIGSDMQQVSLLEIFQYLEQCMISTINVISDTNCVTYAGLKEQKGQNSVILGLHTPVITLLLT